METNNIDNELELEDFGIDVKKDILSILNDCPSLVRLGDKEYMIKNMRYYSLFKICQLAIKMKENEEIDDDNRIITAMCTDLDAMCEIVAIILCNHLFTSEGNKVNGFDEYKSRNDLIVDKMKMRVMESTFDVGQWAAIIIGALKSIDLSGFFLLRKSVSTLTDSLLMRKRKSAETASRFMEALSLQTQVTS